MMITSEQIELFVEACHRAGCYGLIRYSSGNMSWRLDDTHFAITAKGSWLGELRPDQVAVCRLADGACVNNKRCSIEGGFHRGVLNARPEANVVLHFQTPCATAIACAEPADYNFDILPEMPVYIGPPTVVDYFKPGTPELAQGVIDAMKTSNMAILRNHGLVTLGRDFDEALQRAGFFELICEILLSGVKIKPLSAEAVKDLLSGVA